MRLVLEKKDVISFIGKAIGRKLTEAQVEIIAEPFEVIIYDAEDVLGGDAPAPEEEVPPPAPTPKKQAPVVIDDDGSLDELHAHSAALAAQRPPTGGKGKKAKVQRQLMPGESLAPRNPLDGGDADG